MAHPHYNIATTMIIKLRNRNLVDLKHSMKMKIFILCFNFISYGQNDRDLIIHDSIYPILYDYDKYDKVKEQVLSLEKKYGKEPDLRYNLLNQSYVNNDISFFKENLTDLVKSYGVQINYFNESEQYFNAITEGELASWFKEMYLKNHFIWMKNNFNKQRDISKINQIHHIDQLVYGYLKKIRNSLTLDSLNLDRLREIKEMFFLDNLQDLQSLTKKINTYPTGKNYAVFQNTPGITEVHLLPSSTNIREEYWEFFLKFYKKAYLNNNMDYIIFKNYDYFYFLDTGFQKYGLIKPNKGLENYLGEKIDSIPIENKKFQLEIKKEFGW